MPRLLPYLLALGRAGCQVFFRNPLAQLGSQLRTVSKAQFNLPGVHTVAVKRVVPVHARTPVTMLRGLADPMSSIATPDFGDQHGFVCRAALVDQ